MEDPAALAPFFIVGTGRCGTSLLRRLVQKHPQVWIARETHWLPMLFHAYGGRRISQSAFFDVLESCFMGKGETAFDRLLRFHAWSRDDFKAAFRARLEPSGQATTREHMQTLYSLFAERSGARIHGDKTPDYGHCMGLIQNLWPGARFVHIMRDGRDVALSMAGVISFRYLAAWGENYWWLLSHRKHYAARQSVVGRFIPYERFFTLWHQRWARIRDESTRLPAGCYLELRYEDLLARPQRSVQRVLDFLALPEVAGWLPEAVGEVDRGILGKNSDSPDWLALTRQFPVELREAGYLAGVEPSEHR